MARDLQISLDRIKESEGTAELLANILTESIKMCSLKCICLTCPVGPEKCDVSDCQWCKGGADGYIADCKQWREELLKV
jgi:hypothetical protein